MASRALWTTRVAAWKRSGLTAEQFAALHHLRPATLRWWASALRRPAQPPVHFVRILPSDAGSPAPSSVDIVLSGGRHVRVQKGFDPELLRAVVEALEHSA